MDRRSELRRQYKMRKRFMGVFQIVNQANGKRLVDSSPNLDVIYNRHQFQLRMGMHPNHQLQEDWNRFGADSFHFEVLEKLDDSTELSTEVYEQLKTMKEEWLEKLQPFGERGYNG
jgi:hypothetical protein